MRVWGVKCHDESPTWWWRETPRLVFPTGALLLRAVRSSATQEWQVTGRRRRGTGGQFTIASNTFDPNLYVQTMSNPNGSLSVKISCGNGKLSLVVNVFEISCASCRVAKSGNPFPYATDFVNKFWILHVKVGVGVRWVKCTVHLIWQIRSKLNWWTCSPSPLKEETLQTPLQKSLRHQHPAPHTIAHIQFGQWMESSIPKSCD